MKASYLEWTILHPVEFMVNKLEWTESIQSEGAVREAFPDIPSATVYSTVKSVTGKEARTFKQWVLEHKENFI